MRGLFRSKRNFLLAILGAVCCFVCCRNDVFAVSISNGIVEDSNGVRWTYVFDDLGDTDDSTRELLFSFYDKPSDASTIVVPSFSEMLGLIPDMSGLDSYVLVNANISDQNTKYSSSYPRRSVSAETTKLDMSNTSKIQIRGTRPIINPSVETELAFGENMVIGDGFGVVIRATVCSTVKYQEYGDRYYCGSTEDKTFLIPNSYNMTNEEIENYTATAEDIGCYLIGLANSLTYDASKCYVSSVFKTPSYSRDYIGAFAGNKLKLTNFVESNFNYIGWEAFAETEINGQTVTISGDAFAGGNIFRGSNIKKAIINTNTIGAGVFRDCDKLNEIVFDDSVTRVTDDAFVGTNLGSFDFSSTNIKTIGPRAFENAGLTEINLSGIERIEFNAFKNNDIRELYLPKSINYLGSYLFENNSNLKKLTVAYDTLTSGTILSMSVVLGEFGPVVGNGGNSSVEELHVVAPYSEDEELSPTHVSYEDYKWKYSHVTQEYMPQCDQENDCGGLGGAATNDYGWANFTPYNTSAWGGRLLTSQTTMASLGHPGDFEVDYAKVDEKKNIIAPIYFSEMHNLKKIYIHDGYEFIGSSAFVDWNSEFTKNNSAGIHYGILDKGRERVGNELILPSTLKGVGNFAFDDAFDDYVDFVIPQNIEFIGIGAFRTLVAYDKDVDFPKLEALGDFAFSKTRTKNVHIYDKIKYYGVDVFADCMYLNDLTLDFDVFNPNIYVAWAAPFRSSGGVGYDGEFHITSEFGPRYNSEISESTANTYGIRYDSRQYSYGSSLWPVRFGTIKFTNKNVSQLPNNYNNCYYSTTSSCGYGIAQNNTLFGHITADKIDIGDTSWKMLSPRMFVQVVADEVVLPRGLEFIPGDAFSDALIEKELVLPDTVKVIGDGAFKNGQIAKEDTVKITHLPASLVYVGKDAFWGDYNLTADLNSSNLRLVDMAAFWGTRLRDVTLPETTEYVRAASFANISTLRNITIDFDLGALAPNSYNFKPVDWGFSQQMLEYPNIYNVITMTNTPMPGVSPTTFYSFFSQSTETVQQSVGGVLKAVGQNKEHNHFGKLTLTDNVKTEFYMSPPGYFSNMKYDEVDMSESALKIITKDSCPFGFADAEIGILKLPEGLESISIGTFEGATIAQPFTIPSTLKTIGDNAFQWTTGSYSNALPEGLTTIGEGAFYGSDLTNDLVIPSTVTSIGESAFNAGDADVHYDTITVKPALTFEVDNDQLVHQLFWNVDVDKMRIESNDLPALHEGYMTANENQEFYQMPFSEIELTNIGGISGSAFDGCAKLEEVDLSENANLRIIGEEAFKGDEKLHIISFSPNIKNATVAIGKNAFNGTAFETMGDSTKDFDLTAAKFDGSDGYAFSGMPKLRTVDVPASFSDGVIPRASFYNDGALEEATIDYRISEIKNAAFANDDKLARVFIWGDTSIEDKNIGGYTQPTRNIDDTIGDGFGPTIPESTDIYAYSTSLAEDYASYSGRDSFEGDFYPLDEVLYITSNKPKVVLNDEQDDFDKSELSVYGLRRDGVVLESNTWGKYDGGSYRLEDSRLNFEKMADTISANPVFGTIWPTPVPLNLLSYENENFKDIDFELVKDPEDDSVRLVNIVYTDAYTRGMPDTDIDPNVTTNDDNPIIPGPIEDLIEVITGPITLDTSIIVYVLAFGLSVVGIVALTKRN